MPTENIPPFVPPYDPTDLKSGHYTETGILNNIFNEVIQMTTVLQDVAASQANRLNFLSQWQSAYTNAMSQVPSFTAGAGPFSGDNTTDSNIRQDLNRVSSAVTQTMQNRQSIVSDNAKALQSNVNQTNDAVNQQSNLGTSIIQEMSTLLSSIFH